MFGLKAKSDTRTLPAAKGSQVKKERCSSVFRLVWPGKDLKCCKTAQLGQNETFLCKAGARSTLKISCSQEGAAGLHRAIGAIWGSFAQHSCP